MIRYYYIHRLQRKKEENKERKKERNKERQRAQNLKSAHLWLLLIVIQLTYTRIGLVYLICRCSVSRVGPTRTAYSIFGLKDFSSE